MHGAAYLFVQQTLAAAPRFGRVYDIGGRFVNGSPRELFPGAEYTVVDLLPGPNVDVVMDATNWNPELPADCVLCLEVLDHCQGWRELLEHIITLLADDGWLIVTCATNPRPPHGVDGFGVGDEYYANIEPGEILPIIDRHFGHWIMELDRYPADIHVLGRDRKVAA